MSKSPCLGRPGTAFQSRGCTASKPVPSPPARLSNIRHLAAEEGPEGSLKAPGEKRTAGSLLMVDLQSLLTTFSPEDRLSVSDFPQLPGWRGCPGIPPHLRPGAPNLTRQGLRRGHSHPLLLLSAAQRISPSDGVGGLSRQVMGFQPKTLSMNGLGAAPTKKMRNRSEKGPRAPSSGKE